MRHLIAFAALLLAACAEEAPAPEGSDAAPAAEAPTPAPQAGEAPEAAAGAREAKVGPATIRYDPEALAAAEAEVPLPPDWSSNVAATKLIPAGRAALMGTAECLYGEQGEATRCEPGKEAGLAIAMVDQPYEALAAKLTEPAPQPITLAGRQGISWKIGAEGEGAEYILVPADGQTLLLVRQFRATGDADQAAIDAALQSLAFEG